MTTAFRLCAVFVLTGMLTGCCCWHNQCGYGDGCYGGYQDGYSSGYYGAGGGGYATGQGCCATGNDCCGTSQHYSGYNGYYGGYNDGCCGDYGGGCNDYGCGHHCCLLDGIHHLFSSLHQCCPWYSCGYGHGYGNCDPCGTYPSVYGNGCPGGYCAPGRGLAPVAPLNPNPPATNGNGPSSSLPPLVQIR